MKSSNEIETTSLTVSVVSRSPRMTTKSRSAPNRGAITPRITARARSVGQPRLNRSSQYMNAASMPAAPWAKLKIPVVV